MNQSALDPRGPAAHAILGLTWTLFTVCVVVYVLVLAALWWALVRRRRESDNQPAVDVRIGHVVSTLTIVTAMTIVGLVVASEVSGRGVTSPSGPGAIIVDVVGHQWWWDFEYRNVTPSAWVTSPNELHI